MAIQSQTIWVLSTKLKSHTMNMFYGSLDLALSSLNNVEKLTSFLYIGKDSTGATVRVESELLHNRIEG